MRQKFSEMLPEIFLITYLIGMSLTFGHAYNHRYHENLNHIDNLSLVRGESTVEAFISGVTWPLYWSTYLFEVDDE